MRIYVSMMETHAAAVAPANAPPPLVLARNDLAAPAAVRVAWSPRVRSLKGVKPQRVPAGGVYIGRALSIGGWRLSASAFANPYAVGVGFTLEESLQRYANRVLAHPLLCEEARALVASGATLYCWCHTLTTRGAAAKGAHLCHGDVLVALFS